MLTNAWRLLLWPKSVVQDGPADVARAAGPEPVPLGHAAAERGRRRRVHVVQPDRAPQGQGEQLQGGTRLAEARRQTKAASGLSTNSLAFYGPACMPLRYWRPSATSCSPTPWCRNGCTTFSLATVTQVCRPPVETQATGPPGRTYRVSRLRGGAGTSTASRLGALQPHAEPTQDHQLFGHVLVAGAPDRVIPVLHDRVPGWPGLARAAVQGGAHGWLAA